MINTQNIGNKELKIILPNTNKALREILDGATKEQLQTLSNGSAKTLGDIINSLFKDTLQNNTQDKILLNLLKNNPTLKNLTDTQTTLKTLLQELPQNTQLKTTLSQFMQNINNIDAKNLQNKLQNSGVFLENKLKNDHSLQHDLKAVLLTAQKEINETSLPNKTDILKHIDKLLLQIDYFQLSSSLANAQTLFIPYEWDMLEDGSLSIKKQNEQQSICDIELTLKKYGSVKLRLGLFEKDQLYITINTQSQELHTLLEENIQQLKQQLFSIGITPKNITFVQNNTQAYESLDKDIGCGFEVSV